MNIRPQNALTLTELLVATILIGIVMAGVASFSLFVKQAQYSTSAGTILAVQTATAMHYIEEDALRAVGDSGNPGILYNDSTSICFRHDVNDPASYNEDLWKCYWYYGPPEGAESALFKCADRPASYVVPPGNFGDCKTSADAVRFFSINPKAPKYFTVVKDSGGRLLYIDITLNSIANYQQPADVIKNPTYQLFTRVSPPLHGR